MQKLTSHIYEHKGVTVYRNTGPGSRLRYAALRGSLASDTLTGMRELINAELTKEGLR